MHGWKSISDRPSLNGATFKKVKYYEANTYDTAGILCSYLDQQGRTITFYKTDNVDLQFPPWDPISVPWNCSSGDEAITGEKCRF